MSELAFATVVQFLLSHCVPDYVPFETYTDVEFPFSPINWNEVSILLVPCFKLKYSIRRVV